MSTNQISPDSYMQSVSNLTPVQNSQPQVNSSLTPDSYMMNLSPSGSQAQTLPLPSKQNMIDAAPLLVPGALTGTGAVLGEMALPVGGGILGAGAGSAAGNFIRTLAPSIFGAPPANVQDLLMQTGGDMASQGLTGFAGKAASEGLGSALSDVPGISKLPGVKVAQAAEDAYHADLTAKTQALQNAYDEEQLAETAHKINLSKPKPLDYKDTQKPEAAVNLSAGDRRVMPDKSIQVLRQVPIDEISGDPGNKIYEGKVQEYQKNAYNPPGELRTDPNGGYIINEGHHRILADVRNGKNSVLAWTPEEETDTAGALKNAQKGTKAAQQNFDEAVAGGPELPKTEEPSILSSRRAGKYLLRAAAVGGIGHALGSYEAGAGVVLTGSQLAKLAKSPQLGAAILTAQRTPASSSASGLINKLILHNLVGETVDLEDGKKATIDQNGNPQPTE